MMARLQPQSKAHGYTLIELLIVVTIIAILASLVLSQAADNASDAKDAVLQENLKFVRGQIHLYELYHDGNYPPLVADAVYGTTLDMEFSNDSSSTKALILSNSSSTEPTSNFTEMPINPFNGGRAIKSSSDPRNEAINLEQQISGEKVGWFYNPVTGELSANAAGMTVSGIQRIDL